MAEDDLINLRHDVDRREQAVTQDANDIAELKAQNNLLKECLGDAVILSRALYAYFGVDRMSDAGARQREEIIKLLNALHDRLGLKGP
jgi:hypothetical protein